MENTKAIHTLTDAVEAYREQQKEIKEGNTLYREDCRRDVMKALADSGLVPIRIEENNLAVLDYEGSEIKFRIYNDGDFWQAIRQDVCEKCGAEKQTYSRAWTAEAVGELIVSPTWEYHECKTGNHSTPEERLISALRDMFGREE